MKKKLIIILISVILFGILGFTFLKFYHFNVKTDDVKNVKAKKLMIVAHPDDEMIWGGSHLIDDEYLVVCVTCGTNDTRVAEFQKMMEYTNDSYIMLDYPDKVLKKRSEWKIYNKLIRRDLKRIIEAKDWELVITHNPDGEYGHIQHLLISEYVTDILPDNLYYFGKYYKKDEVPEDLATIPVINYVEKTTDMVKIYKTQKIIKPYGHMLNHESWIKYEEWEEQK